MGIVKIKAELANNNRRNGTPRLHYEALYFARINYTVMNKFRIKLRTAPLHDERDGKIR